jgi:CBS domain-containing protein
MAGKIRELMTEDPITLEPGASAREAAERMRESDVGALLIVDGDELKGLITDRDIVVRAVAEGKDPDDVSVGDISSSDVVSISAEDSVDDAIKTMREQDVRRVPVLDGEKPVGIVSLGDLAVAQDSDSVLADISAAEPNN